MTTAHTGHLGSQSQGPECLARPRHLHVWGPRQRTWAVCSALLHLHALERRDLYSTLGAGRCETLHVGRGACTGDSVRIRCSTWASVCLLFSLPNGSETAMAQDSPGGQLLGPPCCCPFP